MRIAKTPTYPVMSQFPLLVALCHHNETNPPWSGTNFWQTDGRHARSINCAKTACLMQATGESYDKWYNNTSLKQRQCQHWRRHCQLLLLCTGWHHITDISIPVCDQSDVHRRRKELTKNSSSSKRWRGMHKVTGYSHMSVEQWHIGLTDRECNFQTWITCELLGFF